MECLEKNVRIEKNISTAPMKVIQAFHKLVFGETGDRKNRSRLRNFSGFTFQDEGNEYREKVAFIQENFMERDLITICNILCLDYGGLKEDIAKRIYNSLMDLYSNTLTNTLTNTLCINDDDSDDDDDLDESASDKSDDAVAVSIGNANAIRNAEAHTGNSELPVRRQEGAMRRHDFSLTFRDVEGSIRNFDGSDAYPIERWITDFEDTAILFGWNEMQQLIFTKRLTGLAKLYVQSEGVR